MKNIIAILSIVILFSSCSIYHITSNDISTDYYPSKKSLNDVIYLENINKPNKVIGEVIVNTERMHNISDVLSKMKYEAAVLGGDAITNIKTDATGTWKKLPAQELIGNAYIRANFSADVAVFQ